jgi:hypothetical protein
VIDDFLGSALWCLTPLSTIFQLYFGGQFYWWRKPEYPKKTTDLSQKLLGVVTHLHLVSRKMLVVKYVTCRESQQSEERNNNKAVIYVDLYLYLRIVEGPS